MTDLPARKLSSCAESLADTDADEPLDIEEVLRIEPESALAASKVAVLLISYDTTEQTLRCIESLRAQTQPPAWIGVLDNAPERGDLHSAIVKLPRFKGSQLRLYRSATNLGFADGSNALIKRYLAEESCQNILLLNNDAVALPQLVSSLVSVIARHPEAGMAGGRMHKLDQPDQVDTLGIALYASLMPADRHDTEDVFLGPTGGCAMISRECVVALEEAAGYIFDGRFFCYCEDTDLVLRANFLGFRPVFVDEVMALHEGQASSGGTHNTFIAYHGLRNSIWMVAKSVPSRLLWRYGALFVLANLMSIARYTATGRFGLVFRVYRDALRGFPAMRRDRRRLLKAARLSPAEFEERISRRFYRSGYFRNVIRKLFN